MPTLPGSVNAGTSNVSHFPIAPNAVIYNLPRLSTAANTHNLSRAGNILFAVFLASQNRSISKARNIVICSNPTREPEDQGTGALNHTEEGQT